MANQYGFDLGAVYSTGENMLSQRQAREINQQNMLMKEKEMGWKEEDRATAAQKAAQVEAIKRMGNTLWGVKNIQDHAQRQDYYTKVRGAMPPDVAKEMPEAYDDAWVNIQLRELAAADNSFTNPQVVKQGDEDVTFQSGIEVGRTKSAVTGDNSLELEKLRQAGATERAKINADAKKGTGTRPDKFNDYYKMTMNFFDYEIVDGQPRLLNPSDQAKANWIITKAREGVRTGKYPDVETAVMETAFENEALIPTFPGAPGSPERQEWIRNYRAKTQAGQPTNALMPTTPAAAPAPTMPAQQPTNALAPAPAPATLQPQGQGVIPWDQWSKQ